MYSGKGLPVNENLRSESSWRD